MSRGRKAAGNPKDRRLSKTPLAKELGISRPTLDEYLNREAPPPPQPDKKKGYNVAAVRDYILANGAKAIKTDTMRSLREQILQIDAEEKAFDLGLKKGQYIAREKLEPSAAAVMAQLTADMQAKFEGELPPKYEGLDLVHRQQLNADAIDWVLTRLKKGMGTVMP